VVVVVVVVVVVMISQKLTLQGLRIIQAPCADHLPSWQNHRGERERERERELWTFENLGPCMKRGSL
jgi:hypothetical protein